MNFLEAVQALKDGRCEGIKRNQWREDNILGFFSGTAVLHDELRFQGTCLIPIAADFLADDWQLVGEKPQVEEVEVVRWAVIAPSGFCEATYSSEELADAATRTHQYLGYTVAKLTGTYTRPAPRKVKRREEIWSGNVTASLPFTSALNGKLHRHINKTTGILYFEWEEEAKP